mmetsp:Transcript_2907/g.3064  ORF Transcript_2907/g.3064 Transcript_2907/m.3064 type:complete len:394 (-) Transcript_2907:314-1495(-)|eukprot:CAMPEP_0182417182 /NCGR_PEP_ID=MMETSP1167-20130531/1602_1 /TAXON_ID=2988 /ORGANISM="Mallomonas Sp, Strain CCMP3275" /LENGTH=393 /DNA_ID=CAMNT_0024590551 /DNA_START=102 /DNA_END=1283 /DNA_ORIENTATION=+
MMQRSLKLVRQHAKPANLARMLSTSEVTIDLPADTFQGHLTDTPGLSVKTSKEELLNFFHHMYIMRRMEITNDMEYKARNIRGFCHLYDGQEAVAMGLHAGLTMEDSIITSYRCHAIAILRGVTVEQVFAEMFGFSKGASKGKGGSMHFYKKTHNFYGGQGIVGAQVPVGTGLAFAAKYNTPPGEKMPIGVALYGDGAANQGQIWESANMASLWDLPMVFMIENNKYGMGTSTNRSSSNDKYYTMGNHIPGLRVNGMNVLAVKQATAFIREHCSSGKGPFYFEVDTYRYHGHSMSDPGTTYRTRDEVGGVRQTRDPVEYVKKLLIDLGFATAEEMKAEEKRLRASVEESLAKAKKDTFPPKEWVITDIYSDEHGKDAPLPYVRMPDIKKSFIR